MALTNERAELLAKYLMEDKERAEGLLALPPEEAVAKINADGYDFTVEEIEAFGEQLQAAAALQGGADGELDADALDNVAGGAVGVGLSIGVKVLWKVLSSSNPLVPLRPRWNR